MPEVKLIGAIAKIKIELNYISQIENTRAEHTFEFPIEDNLTLTRLQITSNDKVIHSKVQRKDQAREVFTDFLEKRNFDSEKKQYLKVKVGQLQLRQNVTVHLELI